MNTKLFLPQHKTFTPHRLISFSLVISKDTSDQLGQLEGELMSTEKIKDMRNIVQNARDNIVEARLRVQTLVRRKGALEKSLMSLNGHQKMNQEELDKKKAELELVKKQIEDLEKSIEKLEKEIEDLEALLAVLDAKQTRLSELRTVAVTHHGNLTGKLDENRKKLAKIEDQLHALEASRKLMGMVQTLDIDLLADRSFQTRHFEIEDGLAKIHRAQVEGLRKTKAELEDLIRRLTTASAHLNTIELNQSLFEAEQTHVAQRKGKKEGDKKGKDAELEAHDREARKLSGEIGQLSGKIEDRSEKIRKKILEITQNLRERKLKIRHVELKMDSLARVEGALDLARASIETHLLGDGKEKIFLDPAVLLEMYESLKSTYISFLEIVLNHEDLSREAKEKARKLRLTISKRRNKREKPVNSMKSLLKYSGKISDLYDEIINGLTADQQVTKETLTLVKGRIDMKNTKNLTSLLKVKFEKAREEGTLVEIPALRNDEKASLVSDRAQLEKDYVLSLLDLFLLHSNLPIVRDDLIFEKNKFSGSINIHGKKETFKLRMNKERKTLEIALNPVDIENIQPHEYTTVTIDHEVVRAIRLENQRIIASENPDKDPATVYVSFDKNR